MSQNDPLELWLAGKRAASPPETLARGVMTAVEQVAESRRSVTKAIPHSNLRSRKCVPYLIASAAAIVCAVRAFSFIPLLIEPTPEFSVMAGDSIPEVPDDDRDVSRS